MRGAVKRLEFGFADTEQTGAFFFNNCERSMRADIKAEWIKRLRKYPKGVGALCTPKADSCEWCCLGVLTDIYVEQTPGAVWAPQSKPDAPMLIKLPTGGWDVSFLLDLIADWAKLPADNRSRLSDAPDGDYIDICIKLKDDDPLLAHPRIREVMAFDDQKVCLSELNDHTSSFDLIIELIEKYL